MPSSNGSDPVSVATLVCVVLLLLIVGGWTLNMMRYTSTFRNLISSRGR